MRCRRSQKGPDQVGSSRIALPWSASVPTRKASHSLQSLDPPGLAWISLDRPNVATFLRKLSPVTLPHRQQVGSSRIDSDRGPCRPTRLRPPSLDLIRSLLVMGSWSVVMAPITYLPPQRSRNQRPIRTLWTPRHVPSPSKIPPKFSATPEPPLNSLSLVASKPY